MTKITRDKLNVNVNLELIDSAAYKQSLTLAFSSGEQVDLFNSCGLDSYAAVVNNGYALNLDEDSLLQTYGTGILETVDPLYLDACRVDGCIYGLPTMRDMAIGMFGLAVAANTWMGSAMSTQTMISSMWKRMLFSISWRSSTRLTRIKLLPNMVCCPRILSTMH